MTSLPTAAPTSLSITRYGGTYIGLSWIPSPDLTVINFQLSYRVNGSNQLPSNVSTNGYTTFFIIGGLEPNTTYEITIAAENPLGFGPESTPIFIQTCKL